MVQKFFLKENEIYKFTHIVVLIVLVISFFFKRYEFYLVWPLFCFFGFFSYLRDSFKNLWSLEILAGGIPFVFSIIGAVWLFAGANDLGLLGYNREWSYYAALHGNYLGWLLVGAVVVISRVFATPMRICVLGSSFLFFFLLIAFGIDGVPFIKRFGAVGMILITPILVGLYFHSLLKEKGVSRYLSGVSLISILFTLFLAASNEFGYLSVRTIMNVPSMVLLHGLVNGLVALPCLCLALFFDRRLDESV